MAEEFNHTEDPDVEQVRYQEAKDADVRPRRYEGCCRAAVDSDGHAHDHADWYAEARGLRQELDEARANCEHCGDMRSQLSAVEAERDEALAQVEYQKSLAEMLGANVDALDAEVGASIIARDKALAETAKARAERGAAVDGLLLYQAEVSALNRERDRMRPVVEAAEAFVRQGGGVGDHREPARKLQAAVDAYRSSTPDAEPAPGVPVDTEEENRDA